MVLMKGVYRKRDEFDGKGSLPVWTISGKLANKDDRPCAYEEALDLAGIGKYNLWLLVVMSVVTTAMAMDMFGFSLLVAGSSCEFNLTIGQKGILSSVPFVVRLLALERDVLSLCLLYRVYNGNCFKELSKSILAIECCYRFTHRKYHHHLDALRSTTAGNALVTSAGLWCPWAAVIDNQTIEREPSRWRTLGYLSDTRGRRSCLLVAMTVSCACAVLGSFSPNWIVMAVLKMIGTSFCSSAQSLAYSLLGECTPRRVRGAYMMVMTATLMLNTCFYFALSFLLKLNFVLNLGVWGMTFRPWRLLGLTLALPLGLGALGLKFCFESPKFLINQGRTKDAVTIMKRIHAINHRSGETYPNQKNVLDVMKNSEDCEQFSKRMRQYASLYVCRQRCPARQRTHPEVHLEPDRAPVQAPAAVEDAAAVLLDGGYLQLSGNFDVKDELHSGPLDTDKVDGILEKVEQGRHISFHNIAEELVILDHPI
ncbi:Synaptic vesicle glycoprotein 2B [Eumeta japonica]|uniref:Synaptic vesicle glycoprotein 2B n=1 Tax=Eumeta variegata TaxID=151549 RepID=A0A4C1XAB3_EUMVA|nr:Synaptic vesicle glycoprotein 2B [Eumeta japonica]